MRWAAVMAVGLAGVACAGEGDDPPQADQATTTTVEETTTTELPPPPPTTTTVPVGAVGSPVEGAGWRLVVHDVTDPYGPTTPSGQRLILVDVEVTRLDDGSAGPITLSSTTNFELRSGGSLAGMAADVQSMASIAGSLGAGEARRGSMAFAVDVATTTDIRLAFRPALTRPVAVEVQLA